MGTYVALLHSIVLGPGRRLAMADLRSLAEELGFDRPRTLVATGNLVFEADEGDARALEARLEPAFAARFDKHIDIVVRSASAWRRLAAGNPYLEAAEAAPASVHVRVMRAPLAASIVDDLERYRSGREAIAVVDGDLWLHFPHGFGGSRLGAALTPRRAGGVGTVRNWNTVRRLAAMVHSE